MIVGISGHKGAGKDAIAEHLVQKHQFKRIGYADVLKDSVCKLLDISMEQLEEWKNNDLIRVSIWDMDDIKPPMMAMTFRNFLQRYGTEAHRDTFGEDFWVNQLILKPTWNVVVPDVRFENEAINIRNHGGVLWRVFREQQSEDSHASEQGIPSRLITSNIVNTGTLEHLFKLVDALVERHNFGLK